MIASVVIYSILGHFFKWPKVSSLFSRENFWLVLRYFGYYLAGAIAWSYGKWLFYLRDFRTTRDKKVAEYKKNREENAGRYSGELTVEYSQ